MKTYSKDSNIVIRWTIKGSFSSAPIRMSRVDDLRVFAILPNDKIPVTYRLEGEDIVVSMDGLTGDEGTFALSAIWRPHLPSETLGRYKGLKTIEYSDKVVSVEHDYKYSLYKACPNATKVIYGKKLSSDAYNDSQINFDGHTNYEVLWELDKLKTIKVHKKNRYFAANKLFLYEKKGNIRYWYGDKAKEKLIIPEGMKELFTEHMEGKVDHVKTLVLNKQLEKLFYDGDIVDAEQGLDALHVFPNLEQVIVPKENINYFVQDGCIYEREECKYDPEEYEGFAKVDADDEWDIADCILKMKEKAKKENQPIPEVYTEMKAAATPSKEYPYVMRGYINKSGCKSIQVPDCVNTYETDWLNWHPKLKIELYLPRTVLACGDMSEGQVKKIEVDSNNFMYYSDGHKLRLKYKIKDDQLIKKNR